MVEIHLELVKTLVLESHLRDIFCLQMYALVTLAHIYNYLAYTASLEEDKTFNHMFLIGCH